MCFDSVANLPGEEQVLFIEPAISGDATADVEDPALFRGAVPTQVEVTNYRLKLFEPTVSGADLQVSICSGHNLRSEEAAMIVDAAGIVGTYAVLSLTGGCHRTLLHPKVTTVQSGAADPVWNESFLLSGVEASDCLQINLFHRRTALQDVPLGFVSVPNVALWEGDARGRSWCVRLPVAAPGSFGASGVLRLQLRCCWPERPVARHCSVPLQAIEDVRLAGESGRSVEVCTKLGRRFLLRFDRPEESQALVEALLKRPDTTEDLFAFALGAADDTASSRPYKFAWQQVLERYASRGGDKTSWAVHTDINAWHGLCETYPESLLLPSSACRADLEASARYRANGRVPMVSWLHPESGAALVRSGQPMTGVLNFSTTDADCDIRLVKSFAAASNGELTVCDCRNFMTAQANRFRGGGTENNMAVHGFHLKFLEIASMHDMRQSLSKVRQLFTHGDTKKGNPAIAEWLGHVHSLLSGAAFIADLLEGGETVVVHCTDGWDRTSQLCSLVSIMSDGHYRTLEGFAELVEKDWLHPGHKFRHRNGLGAQQERTKGQRDLSPIFLQFLDGVAQLWKMHPEHFEYSLEFLAFVLYHAYSGRFATFLGNSELERSQLRTEDRGACLWAEVLRTKERWLNPTYDAQVLLPGDGSSRPLPRGNLPLHTLSFCRELYLAPNLGLWSRDVRVSNLTRAAIQPAEEAYRRSGSDVERPWTVVPTAHGNACFAPTRSPSNPTLLTPKLSKVTKMQVHMSTDVDFEDENETGCETGDSCEGPVAVLPANLLAADGALRRFLGLPETLPGQPIVEIMSHMTRADHQEFIIKTVCDDDSFVGTKFTTWRVSQRYSHFRNLKRTLKREAGIVPAATFPMRTKLSCGRRNLDLRKDGLDLWLKAAVRALIDAEVACYEDALQRFADASGQSLDLIKKSVQMADPGQHHSYCRTFSQLPIVFGDSKTCPKTFPISRSQTGSQCKEETLNRGKTAPC